MKFKFLLSILFAITWATLICSCIDEGAIDKKIDEQIPEIIKECRGMCVRIMEDDFPQIFDEIKQDLVDDLVLEIENRFYDYFDALGDFACLSEQDILCLINQSWYVWNGGDPGDFSCF